MPRIRGLRWGKIGPIMLASVRRYLTEVEAAARNLPLGQGLAEISESTTVETEGPEDA